MNNTVMKDVEKAEHAFTNDEAMRYKYMLREKEPSVIIIRAWMKPNKKASQ